MKKIFKIPFHFIKSHKIISILILATFLVLGFIFRPKPTLALETQKVEYKNLVQSVSVSGDISSENIANMSFLSSGKLVYLVGKTGESVFAGQIIASLDKTKLQANLRQYQQDFNAAKAAVEQVYDQTKRASDLNFSQKVSQTSAEAAQNKAYDNMQIVEQQLRDANLVSPINGTIVREDVETVGSNVTATNIFTIADTNKLIFKMEIDEADIAKIKIGQKVKIILDSAPDQTIESIVASIDIISHTTSTGGNAFTVKTDIISGLELLKIGMSGDAEIIIKELEHVLTVPNSAIFDDNKVYVQQGTKKVKKTIKLGTEGDIETEVLSGLEENELVITQPSLVSE